MPPGRSGRPELLPAVHQVCRTSDLEIGWGYAKQVEIVAVTTHSSSMAQACDGSMPSRIGSVSRGARMARHL